MSTDELAKLQKLLDLGDKVVPIAKFTLGTAAAIMSAVLGIAVWVWTTNASIAAIAEAVTSNSRASPGNNSHRIDAVNHPP